MMYFNLTIIHSATSTYLTKIETNISSKVNFAVRNYLCMNYSIICKLVHVSVMFLDNATVGGYIAIIKGNYYKNIVTACYVGTNLILSCIKTINQTQKVVIHVKFIHLSSNIDNTIFRLNIIFEHFLTDELTSITQPDKTFDMANDPITMNVNNFRLSLLLSCICRVIQIGHVTLSLSRSMSNNDSFYTMLNSLKSGEYTIRIDTVDGRDNENVLYTNLSDYHFSINTKYDNVSFEFGNMSHSITSSKLTSIKI